MNCIFLSPHFPPQYHRFCRQLKRAGANALGIGDAWGSLAAGRKANISILEEVAGDFVFFDGTAGNVRRGTRLLEPRLVIRDGAPLPCRSFYHLPNEG